MPFALLRRFRSARPGLLYISRLTATATFAYVLALAVPAGTSRPVLAPLTALLVLQASLYQTIRSAIRKVLSVTVGVLVAVGVAEFIGFSWWQLALVIGGALGFAGRPQVQPARTAIGRLAGQVAGLLDRMAADLASVGQGGNGQGGD